MTPCLSWLPLFNNRCRATAGIAARFNFSARARVYGCARARVCMFKRERGGGGRGAAETAKQEKKVKKKKKKGGGGGRAGKRKGG